MRPDRPRRYLCSAESGWCWRRPPGQGRSGALPVGALCLAGAVLAVIAIAPAARGEGTGAKSILKSMSDYLASQKTIELTFDSDIEVITPQMEKIQFPSSGELLFSRPDKLRAHRVSGHADVAMIFDGKTVSIDARSSNGYAQFEAPGSLDQLVEAMRAGHGVSMPGGDLLKSNPYDALAAGIKEAKVVGRGVVDGVVCEHLAFRNFDTDWQLWVEVGEKPIPRKLVITSKTLNSAPQYTIRFKTWKTGVTPAAGAFTYVPPAGARKLSPEGLIDLDELPQGAPEGVN